MRRLSALLLSAVLIGGLSGCSTVTISSTPQLNKNSQTGVKFYYSKPYLLVTRTGAKDNPISVQIVYLPDVENPQYAHFRTGLGSTQLNLELTNSILSKFGQTGDSKIPETLTAVGSLLGGAAGAFKTIREANNLQNQALSVAELRDAAGKLKAASGDLAQALADAKQAKIVFTDDQGKQINTTIDTLKSVASRLEDPAGLGDEAVQKVVGNLETLLKNWDAMQVTAGPNDQDVQRYNGIVIKLKDTVTQVKDNLKKGSAPPPEAIFELYEIRQKNGTTELVRVQEPKPAGAAAP